MRLVLAAIALAFAVLYRAPATLADALVDGVSAKQVRIIDAKGNLRNGDGVLVVRHTDGTWHPWIAIEWTLGIRSLLLGALEWHLTSGGHPIATVRLSPFHVSIANV